MKKKQYIRPAHEQMTATIETFIAESIQVSNQAQNDVSGDTKEYKYQNSDRSVWNEEW